MHLAFSTTVITRVEDFEHAVAEIPDSALIGASGLVLRVDAQLWLMLMSDYASTRQALDAQAQAVAIRAPHVDVYAIPDGHSSAVSRPPYVARHTPRLLFSSKGVGAVFEPAEGTTVSAIREQDLARYIDAARSRCIICAASSYHFALPSGAHAAHFLRLSEAFVDLETVDRIAYWVALHIESKIEPLSSTGQYALLVDHPSMLILAARVQLLVSVRLEIVTFPTYPSDTETRAATFDLLRRVATRCSTVFVLIGVASTGRLAKFVNRWAQDVSNVSVISTILYTVQDVEGVNSLCHLNLPDYKHFVSSEVCGLCAAQSHPVAIQASNYMVGYGPAKSVSLGPAFFNDQKIFLEKWGQYSGVLRVHYDDPNESTARHHAFYVDVDTLMDLPDFRDEVFVMARGLLPAPTVIAIPDQPAANRIGRLVAEALNIPLVVLSTAMLNGQGPVDDTLRAATCLLVLDDVFITGTRLDAINRFLREHTAERVPALLSVHFMTLLATPPSDKKYRERRNGMTGHHGWAANLYHLYKFVLPDWHTKLMCPWCREQGVLSRLAQSSNVLDGPLTDRLADLGNPVAGMSDSVYFVAPRDVGLPLLGTNSAVLHENATPLQVLFACASAIQQLRHAEQNPLNAEQFPAPAYVAERVFSTHYTERIIWLGMLRALKGNELDTALKGYLRRAALNAADAQRHLVHAELAMAWAAGKLDAIEVSDASRRMFEDAGISWQALFDTGLVDGHP